MSLSAREAKKQFDRLIKNGWLPFFEEAAATITKNYFDTADLIAIASRETNLDPKWLTKAGDGGNGYGLMQADLRSFPDWIKTGKWKIASEGIKKGAEILMQKWTDYENNIGKKLTVKSSKGGTYRYTAQKADGADAQKLVISSYNCGRWSQYAYANNQDIDKYSTGGDYAKDVMSRAAQFRKLLNAQKSEKPQTIAPQAENLIKAAHTKIENKIESSIGEVTEKTTEIIDEGKKQVEKTIEETKSTFQPENYTQYIPKITKSKWLLGTLSIGGIFSTISAKLADMPDWFVLLLGALAGILLTGLVVLIVVYHRQIFALVKIVVDKKADPTQNNIDLISEKPE